MPNPFERIDNRTMAQKLEDGSLPIVPSRTGAKEGDIIDGRLLLPSGELRKEGESVDGKIMKPSGEIVTDLDELKRKFESGETRVGLFQGGGIGTTFLDPPTSPSQGSDDVRNDVTNAQNDVADAVNDTGDQDVIDGALDLPTDSASLSQATINLQSEFQSLKTTTEEELALIEEAGQAAGAEFDPLITDAEVKKAQGESSALVKSGRGGGFLRARIAGRAALEGGESFVGKGGKLEEIGAAYDRNINALQSAKLRAISSAKAAARIAIRTGKQTDFKNATTMLGIARQAHQDAIALAAKKIDIMFQASANQRAEVKTEFDIASQIKAGETVEIAGQIFTGIDLGSVDPFFSSSNIISLMKTLPEGETAELIDPGTGEKIQIVGIRQDDPGVKSIQSTSDSGEVMITRYDVNSGEILSQTSAGEIGKSKAAPISLILNQQQKEIVGSITQAMNDSKEKNDGFVDAKTYEKQQTKFIAETGKTANEFKATYAPEEHLDPQDPDSKKFFQTSSGAIKGPSLSDIIAEAAANSNIDIED